MKLIVFLLIAYIIIVLLARNLKETFRGRKKRKWTRNNFKETRRKVLELFFKNMEKKSIEQIKKAIERKNENRKKKIEEITSIIKNLKKEKRQTRNLIQKNAIQRKITKTKSNQKYIQKIFKRENVAESTYLLKRINDKKHEDKMAMLVISEAQLKNKSERKQDEEEGEEDEVDEEKEMLDAELRKADREMRHLARISRQAWAQAQAQAQTQADHEKMNLCNIKKEELNELIAKTYPILEKAKIEFNLENYIKKSCKESDS